MATEKSREQVRNRQSWKKVSEEARAYKNFRRLNRRNFSNLLIKNGSRSSKLERPLLWIFVNYTKNYFYYYTSSDNLNIINGFPWLLRNSNEIGNMIVTHESKLCCKFLFLCCSSRLHMTSMQTGTEINHAASAPLVIPFIVYPFTKNQILHFLRIKTSMLAVGKKLLNIWRKNIEARKTTNYWYFHVSKISYHYGTSSPESIITDPIINLCDVWFLHYDYKLWLRMADCLSLSGPLLA